MTVRSRLLSLLQQEDINFLLTNRIPHRLATQFIGWFSRIEQPLVRDISNCLDAILNLQHRGSNVIACDARYRKGDELGRFEHGSTIIVFAPDGFSLCDNVGDGATIRVGEPLMRLA